MSVVDIKTWNAKHVTQRDRQTLNADETSKTNSTLATYTQVWKSVCAIAILTLHGFRHYAKTFYTERRCLCRWYFEFTDSHQQLRLQIGNMIICAAHSICLSLTFIRNISSQVFWEINAARECNFQLTLSLEYGLRQLVFAWERRPKSSQIYVNDCTMYNGCLILCLTLSSMITFWRKRRSFQIRVGPNWLWSHDKEQSKPFPCLCAFVRSCNILIYRGMSECIERAAFSDSLPFLNFIRRFSLSDYYSWPFPIRFS